MIVRDGRTEWTTRDLEDLHLARVAELMKEEARCQRHRRNAGADKIHGPPALPEGEGAEIGLRRLSVPAC